MSQPLAIFTVLAMAAILAVAAYAVILRHSRKRPGTRASHLAAEAQATISRREAAQSNALAPWECTLGANGLNCTRDAGDFVMVASVSQKGRESPEFNWWAMGKGMSPENRSGSRPSKALAQQAAERAALLFGWNVDGKTAPLPDAAFTIAQGQAAALGVRLVDRGDDWFAHCGECGAQLAGGKAGSMAEAMAGLKDAYARWEAEPSKRVEMTIAPCRCKRLGKLRAV
jgi:hypothetical protein